jgi:hypothetical protein
MMPRNPAAGDTFSASLRGVPVARGVRAGEGIPASTSVGQRDSSRMTTTRRLSMQGVSLAGKLELGLLTLSLTPPNGITPRQLSDGNQIVAIVQTKFDNLY